MSNSNISSSSGSTSSGSCSSSSSSSSSSLVVVVAILTSAVVIIVVVGVEGIAVKGEVVAVVVAVVGVEIVGEIVLEVTLSISTRSNSCKNSISSSSSSSKYGRSNSSCSEVKTEPSVGHSLILTTLGDTHFNPFPNKPWFLRVCSTSFLKTPWKKEKLLVTSNFSFSHSVFYLFDGLSAIFIEFEIVVCKRFQ